MKTAELVKCFLLEIISTKSYWDCFYGKFLKLCVCVYVWLNIYIYSCRAFIHVLKFSIHFFILKCKKYGRVSFSPVFVFLPESSLLQRRNQWCVFVTSLLIGMKQRVQVVFLCVYLCGTQLKESSITWETIHSEWKRHWDFYPNISSVFCICFFFGFFCLWGRRSKLEQKARNAFVKWWCNPSYIIHCLQEWKKVLATPCLCTIFPN